MTSLSDFLLGSISEESVLQHHSNKEPYLCSEPVLLNISLQS